ncbi:hypothetical protein GSB9_01958 [Flavobacteriaceae bacterium GSB9]|nr:hypothetical protein GSB9_01958 [Flavobacteriaceae bacterium GSB9]
MKTSNFKLLTILIAMVIFVGTFTSCSDNNEPTVNITVNQGQVNDVSGDFTGNGGSGTRTISWSNNNITADYNADITSTATGTFQMVVADANGTVVLDRNLNGSTEPDSFSGVTDVGEPGNWTVNITLTTFNGDGSYSLGSGN